MQQDRIRRSNPQRSAEMRARLVTAARAFFLTHGYAATATPAIVAAAGVTRGALYHHFDDKRAIFYAVIEAEAHAAAAAIMAADDPHLSATERLVAGGFAYLAAMQVPGRARLMLVDGPAVLGHETIRGIEAGLGEAMLREGLAAALGDGEPHLPVGALASLLSAMFERASLDLAEGAVEAEVQGAVQAVVIGLVGTRHQSAKE
jgi:AcrR family transcriptional regulator